MEEVSENVKVALKLTAAASYDINRRRRRNILNHTDPRSYYLLEDPKSFSSKQTVSSLFGKRFLEAMLKEADQDEKLSRRGPPGPAPKTAAGPVTRSKAGRGGRGQFPFDNDRGGGRGRRYVTTQNDLIVSMPHPPPASFCGGRLRFFQTNWGRLSSDPWVLSTISNGLQIDFLSVPFQSFPPLMIRMAEEMEKVCDEEVVSLLEKKAIEETSDSDGFFSALFVIPKKAGGYRPIVNLKALNNFVAYSHFNMEGLEAVKQLLEPGDFMTKIDLKDAYLFIPVLKEHKKFLRFCWGDKKFQFTCLPFGLSAAPRVFTKVMKVVMGHLRAKGIRLIIYLDDILILSRSFSEALDHCAVVADTLTSLGFVINETKSVKQPVQRIDYLGVVVDSTKLSFALPQEKMDQVLKLCKKALGSKDITLRDISKILGNFAWAIHSIPFAQMHYRQIQDFHIQQLHKWDRDLSKRIILPAEARSNLDWWINNLQIVNGKPFFPRSPHLEIYSDASLSGWGAICDDVRTRGPWTAADRNRHINELEILAAFHAVKSFAGGSSKIAIKLYLDNSTAVCYINKGGGTRSIGLSILANLLNSFCEERSISLEAFFLPGKLNVEADEESRAASDSSDWMLCRRSFQAIDNIWATDVDLFSASWNHQHDRFISWRPQPGAWAVNAFSKNWGEFKAYAFPPFSMISRCLAKVKAEEARLLLICPVWPSQTWFPSLLELACDTPRILPPKSDILLSAQGDYHPLAEKSQLLLSAWMLSGQACQTKAFRQKWSTFCWQEAVQPRILHTRPPGTLGQIGVLNSIPIPCLAL